MAYPQPPNFTSNRFGDAWWHAQRGRTWNVVEYTGFASIAQMQAMIFAGVRPGARTWDGTMARRIRIDGNWGPETMRGLYAYALARHAPDNLLAFIRNDGQRQRISRDSLGIGLWYTFHQPRAIDLDVGPVTGGTRVQRTDAALLFDVPLDAIRLNAATVPPAFLSRPGIPEVGDEVLRLRPIVRELDDQGRVVSTTQAPAPAPTPASTTPTPAPAPAPAPIRVLPARNTMLVVFSAAAVLGGGYLLFSGSRAA